MESVLSSGISVPLTTNTITVVFGNYHKALHRNYRGPTKKNVLVVEASLEGSCQSRLSPGPKSDIFSASGTVVVALLMRLFALESGAAVWKPQQSTPLILRGS